MLRALLLACLAAPSAPQGVPRLSTDDARDVTGEGLAFLEVESPRAERYAGERVRVTVRLGFEEGFLAGNLVPLFRRELDVPAQVQAEGLVPLAPPPDAPTRTLAFNGDVVPAAVAAARERDGRRFAVFELTAEPAGSAGLGTPRLRFAYTSRFEEDPFRGRVPVDRLDAYVTGDAPALAAGELPAEGRPPDFSGAVGSFTVTATAAPRDLVLGGTLRLTLAVEGRGELDGVMAPRLDGGRDFDLLGVLDGEVAEGRRTFVYDLAPRREGSPRVPGIAFTFFDPDAGAYRTETTAPVTVLVRPGARPPASDPPAAEPAEPRRGAWALAALLGGLGVLAVLAVALRRRS